MSLLNVGLFSKNTGDFSGDNRDNSNFFVVDGGDRRTKGGRGGRGSHESGKGKGHRRHRHCED